MRRFFRPLVKHLVSRMTDEVAKHLDPLGLRMANEVANHLYPLILNTAFCTLPKDVTPYQLFAGIDDETWFWMHTEGYRRIPALKYILPSLPEEEYQRRSVGSSGDDALRHGLGISRVFKTIYEKHVGDFSACNSVLDFGCGWGRVMRFLMKDIEPSRLWGIDVLEKAITFCEQTNKWSNFLKNDMFPPTTFREDMFNLVFAYSVFSHFSEEMHEKWLEEIHRILRPGGLFIATTYGREMISKCRDLRETKQISDVQPHLPELFPHTEESLASYDNGDFCFDSSADVYGANSRWLGEACIPKGYVLNKHSKWSKYFDFEDYIFNDKDCRQNIIIVKKGNH